MASANWMKATTQKAGAMKKHLGQKERETGNHSNPHIDRSLTHLNYALGCSDYAEALERMKARTMEVDQLQPPQRIRKDRVTCCFLEVPCPRELTRSGMSDEFFKRVYDEIIAFFGPENVHGGFVHKDEVHDYVDEKGASRASLEHLHGLVSAYTDKKGINGKAFETRTRLRAFNQALDDMCVREFGIPFNTGERPGHKTVEQLKAETELRKEIVELSQEADRARDKRDDVKAEVWLAEREKMAVMAEKDIVQGEVEALRGEKKKLQEETAMVKERLRQSQVILKQQQQITAESFSATLSLGGKTVKLPKLEFDRLLAMAQGGIAGAQNLQQMKKVQQQNAREIEWHRNEWSRLRNLSPEQRRECFTQTIQQGVTKGYIPPPPRRSLDERLGQAQQKMSRQHSQARSKPRDKGQER